MVKPRPDALKRGMLQILLKPAEDARDVFEINRLAVPSVQSREDADDFCASLRSEDGVGGLDRVCVKVGERVHVPIEALRRDVRGDVPPRIFK